MSVNGGDGSDVNKAKGDFGLSDIARIGEQYNRVPYAQRELRQRHANALERLKWVQSRRGGVNGDPIDEADQADLQILEEMLGATKDKEARGKIKSEIRKIVDGTVLDPAIQRIKAHSENTINRVAPRIRMHDESTRERLNTQAVNTVAREMSDTSVGSYVSSRINSQEVQVAAMGVARSGSFEDLQSRRQNIMSQIGALRNQSITAAGSLVGEHGIDAEAQNALKENAAKIKELASQLGPIAAAMKTQKALGEDPESRQRNTLRIGQKAEDYLAFEKLQNSIRSGEGEFGKMGAKELKQKETEAAEKLIKALDELSKSAGKSKEEIAQLSKHAEEAAKDFEKIQEARRAGAGDNGGFARGAGAWGSAVVQAAALAGNAFQVLGINQPMMRMANAGAYAAIENQKHDSWRAAVAGDMTERLNLAGWSTAHQFGRDGAFHAGGKVTANIVGGAAGIVAGGAQMAEVVASTPGGATVGKVLGNPNIVTNGAGATIALGEAALLEASSIQDARHKISTSQAETSGIFQTMDTVRRMNHIPGYQLQRYRDHLQALHAGSMFMGRNRDSFLAEGAGANYLSSMASFGISSDQVGSLSMFGGQTMGSMFSADQILQSKRFENLGFGSADENIRRMAALGAGSTQNPSQSLEKLLERAVSVGLDSSKSITMIAESTGAFAEKSALEGFADVGGQISAHILAAIDRNNPNQELAAKQAVGVYQSAEDLRNNRSASFHGIMGVSRLMTGLGLNWRDAMTLQGMSVDQLRSLQGKSNEEIQNALFARGFDGSYSKKFSGDMRGALNTAIESKVQSQVEGLGGFAIGTGEGYTRILKPYLDKNPGAAERIARGDYRGLPPEVLEVVRNMNWVATNAGGMDGRAFTREAFAAGGYLRAGSGGKLGSGTLGSMPGPYGALTEEMNRGNVSNINAAQQALGVLSDGSGSGVAGINAVNMSGRATYNMVGSNPEAVWADAAANSARDFGESAVKLNKASDKLIQAAENILSASGIAKIVGFKPVNTLPDNMSHVQDNLSRYGE